MLPVMIGKGSPKGKPFLSITIYSFTQPFLTATGVIETTPDISTSFVVEGWVRDNCKYIA